jgi:CheY-like chemotaxis protein
MVGDELLRYLRRHNFADLPVIVMTASLHPSIYLSQGASDVLPKPFDMDMLFEKVARYMPPADQEQSVG